MNNFSRQKEIQASIFAELTDRLQKAGADFVVLPSIGGSFCLNEFMKKSPLPVQDVMTPLSVYMDKYKGKTIGLIGTNKAMNTKIYNFKNEIDWLIPMVSNLTMFTIAMLRLQPKEKQIRKN